MAYSATTVLPEPVGAHTIVLSPRSIALMALIWKRSKGKSNSSLTLSNGSGKGSSSAAFSTFLVFFFLRPFLLAGVDSSSTLISEASSEVEIESFSSLANSEVEVDN